MITGKSDDDLELVHGTDNIWQDFDYADADPRNGDGMVQGEFVQTTDGFRFWLDICALRWCDSQARDGGKTGWRRRISSTI